MAVPKICGIETEFGIQAIAPGEQNPVTASSLLINAYVNHAQRKVDWDFVDETPGNDARGFAEESASPPEVETHLVNTVLTNGARFYVDHAHPEYSSPECTSAREVLLYDKAGEEILRRSMRAAEALYGDQGRIVVYKNNSDRKGNSYGCHENYLMDRQVPFSRVVKNITTHFVTRQIYTGAGKVGHETRLGEGMDPEFQLTQRAEFFEEEVGLETTLKRPIVNTRDEPHCDAQKYRRLHVIVGDANLSEVATFLKVGVTAAVLAMIEDDWLSKTDVSLAHPVKAIRQVSCDLTLSEPLDLASGRKATALELQWELFELARKYQLERGLACIGDEDSSNEVMVRWERVLETLERDPMELANQLDWVAKYRLLTAYAERHGIPLSSDRIAAMDLQYHDLRPAKSLYQRLGMERLVEEEQVIAAIDEPPHDTRAYFRGRCLKLWSSSITAANWDSLVFDLGTDPLRRVPMMDPLRGTAAHVDKLLEGCSSPAELLERLGS